MIDLNSDKMPNISYEPDISDLFMFFGINWEVLSPAIYLIVGLGFGFFLAKIIKKIND